MYITEGQTFEVVVTWEEEVAESEDAPPVKVTKAEARTYQVVAASGLVATEEGVEVLRAKVIARKALDGVG